MMKVFNRTYKTDAGEKRLYNALIYATSKSGATIFKADKHSFYPKGLSAFIILGESHSALHSFPEDNTVWVEVVSCADTIDIDTFFESFEQYITTDTVLHI